MNESTSFISSVVDRLCATPCSAAATVIKHSSAPKPLTELGVGGKGTISDIKVANEHRGRILEMGLLKGTQVQLVRFAPLGDPLEIKLRGYHLTLRRHEADRILIKPL